MSALLLILAGCGSSHGASVDASLDSSPADGGQLPPVDAATGVDGAVGVDGSTPRDAGSQPLDAGPPEPCDTPGATETVACGMCGQLQRFCGADGTWANGPCADEGECMPGTTASAACGNCGTQTARCTSSCTWDATGACEGEGECSPGMRMTTTDGCSAPEMHELECDSTCTYHEVSACMAEPCDTPGTSEVSVQGGHAAMGSSDGGVAVVPFAARASMRKPMTSRSCLRSVSTAESIRSMKRLPRSLCVPNDNLRRMTA